MMQPEDSKRATDGAYDRSKPKPKPKSRLRGRSKDGRDTDTPSDDSRGQAQVQSQRKPARARRRRRRRPDKRRDRQSRDATGKTETSAKAVASSSDIQQVNERDRQQKDQEPDTRPVACTGEGVGGDDQLSASEANVVADDNLVSVVGVKFRKSGKVYYFAPNDVDLSAGDTVVVETARGMEYGSVVCGPKQIPTSEVVSPLKPVVRKGTAEDQEQARENQEKEKQAFDICLEKIAHHELPMKLVDVEYTFDRNKLIFYFTADGRVDFRELVKDLASVFRTRIELRQIGVRDEAKMIGGLGCCGRPMCCASFLGDFEPVSIKMAKEQNLSLNPTKISGVCGRLMCCLRYEYEAYKACKHGLPKVGQEIRTAKGLAKVVDVDILRRLARLDYGDGNQQVVPVDEISTDSRN